MNSGAQIGLSSWLMFGLSFLGVLAAMLAVFLVARRLLGRLAGPAGAPRIRVIENLAIGPRQRIMLLSVREHQILVGATQQQITTLARWDTGGDEPAQPTGPGQTLQPSAPHFLFKRRPAE